MESTQKSRYGKKNKESGNKGGCTGGEDCCREKAGASYAAVWFKKVVEYCSIIGLLVAFYHMLAPDGTVVPVRVAHHDWKEPVSIQSYARELQGSTYGEWKCLQRLWYEESRWNYLSVNPDSGATGIPQALPASKMRIEGDDYLSNPFTQVRWGLRYLGERYSGSACIAVAHKDKRGWY